MELKKIIIRKAKELFFFKKKLTKVNPLTLRLWE